MTQEDELLERIIVRPEIFDGKQIIRDMRIAVEHVPGQLAAGETAETILGGYPFLEPADIQACPVFVHRSMTGERVHDRISIRKTS